MSKGTMTDLAAALERVDALERDLDAVTEERDGLRKERDDLERSRNSADARADRHADSAADLAATVEDLRAEGRDADAFDGMMPRDGYLPGAPPGWMVEAIRYPATRECRVRFVGPTAVAGGARPEITTDLARLPLILCRLLAAGRADLEAVR